MSKDDILIFGSGYIGKRLQDYLDCNITSTRINNLKDAENQIKKFAPKIIINCIGYTGEKNVDDCEKNIDKTLLANTFVPIFLTEAALRNKIKLVHLSTGCIFHYSYKNKQKPITEENQPDFLDLFYSRSKIYSEQALKNISQTNNFLILRLRVPLDNKPHPKNILTKLLSYEKIINLPNSITYLPDFVKMVEHLINIDAKGIYHTVNKGALKYSDLLEEYKKHFPEHKYDLVDFKELNIKRTNLVMSVDKLEKTGFKVRDVQKIIPECVEKYIKIHNLKK